MDNKTFLIATIGHTAAGKTTLSRSIVERINVAYIEEGKIKRNIIGAYKTSDSLNEELRDIAYGKAISLAENDLTEEKSVLIDASFHKLKRRRMIYDMLSSQINSIPLVWLYCYCPNIQKVTRRINGRKTAIKTAATQADSMDIYYHIIQSFDIPDINNVP